MRGNEYKRCGNHAKGRRERFPTLPVLPRPALITPRCSSCSPHLLWLHHRFRIPPIWCSLPPPTCTVTPPTGTTSADKPFPGGLTRVATDRRLAQGALSGTVVRGGCRRPDPGRPFATYFARVAPREPHPVIEAMNLTGYDVATPGQSRLRLGRCHAAAGDRRRGISLCERQHLHPSRRHARCTPPMSCCSDRASGSASPAHHARRDGLEPG